MMLLLATLVASLLFAALAAVTLDWRPIADWLWLQLFKHVAMRRVPNLIIGDRTDPYMLRWWLLPRNPLLYIYLHNVMRSDDDRALHDHPWASISLALKGRVLEHTAGGGRPREIRAGHWRWRSARMAHRLELPVVHTEYGPQQDYFWSLFITGPRVREWGFHCPRGWVPEHTFAETVDGQSTISRGCD